MQFDLNSTYLIVNKSLHYNLFKVKFKQADTLKVVHLMLLLLHSSPSILSSEYLF